MKHKAECPACHKHFKIEIDASRMRKALAVWDDRKKKDEKTRPANPPPTVELHVSAGARSFTCGICGSEHFTLESSKMCMRACLLNERMRIE
jgi:hypothetical protein